ncbi:hypothetical protein CF319_g7018 [Tilletia indica]|nr:hypothetical protein CF319_g7018 [Tilletia indica]
MPTAQSQSSVDHQAAIALPPPLREYLASLDGANDIQGRITDSLSRLNNVIGLFEHALKQRQRELEGMMQELEAGIVEARTVSQDQLDLTKERVSEELLRAENEVAGIWNRTQDDCQKIQAKLQHDLEAAQMRSRTELEMLQKKTKSEVEGIKVRNNQEFDKQASRISTHLKDACTMCAQDLQSMMDALRLTHTDVNRDIREAQSVCSQVQTQMLAMNTWAVAWPEAIRTAQHFQTHPAEPHSSPPEYDRGSNEPRVTPP